VKDAEAWTDTHPEFLPGPYADRVELAELPTSFAKFPIDQSRQLIHRGWWLTGATMTAYHRELLPAELPTWAPLP
jgi:hypothetical protein